MLAASRAVKTTCGAEIGLESFIESEIAKWTKVARAAKIEAD